MKSEQVVLLWINYTFNVKVLSHPAHLGLSWGCLWCLKKFHPLSKRLLNQEMWAGQRLKVPSFGIGYQSSVLFILFWKNSQKKCRNVTNRWTNVEKRIHNATYLCLLFLVGNILSLGASQEFLEQIFEAKKQLEKKFRLIREKKGPIDIFVFLDYFLHLISVCVGAITILR